MGGLQDNNMTRLGGVQISSKHFGEEQGAQTLIAETNTVIQCNGINFKLAGVAEKVYGQNTTRKSF